MHYLISKEFAINRPIHAYCICTLKESKRESEVDSARVGIKLNLLSSCNKDEGKYGFSRSIFFSKNDPLCDALNTINLKQECIQVRCVPSATVAVCWGWVCSRGEGGLVPGVACSRGVPGPGGLIPGGGAWYPNMHWGRPPSLTEWLTDRCKNITFATSLRTVINRALHDKG